MQSVLLFNTKAIKMNQNAKLRKWDGYVTSFTSGEKLEFDFSELQTQGREEISLGEVLFFSWSLKFIET